MKNTLSLFFSLVLVFILSGCVSDGYSGSTPWNMPATGVVTKDPNSIPNIAWQTEHQRDTLNLQSTTFAKEQTTSEAAAQAAASANDPNRPSLQTVVGGDGFTPRKVKVALLLPLSGKKTDIGQSMLKAAQMALFDVGSNNFELIPQDTKSTTDGAMGAARAAVASHVDMILGPIFAEDLKAIKPITDPSNIPVVAFTTDWTLGGGNTYIMGFLPFPQVARVAQYALSKGYSKFAVYAPQTAYCDVVISTLQKTNAQITRVGRYAPQQPDLSSLVADFVATSKDPATGGLEFNALMLPVGGEGLRTLMSLLEQQGIRANNVRLVGTGLWDDSTLTNDPALYGSWFAAPDPALRKDFEKRYQDNYGAAPVRLSSLAYDATALAAVLAHSSVDGEPYSRARMTNQRGFAGIDGIFRFRNDGLSERGLAILELQAGKSRVIDPAPTAFFASGT